MKKEEIAQWVIDNRYQKSELIKVSDFELYHLLVEQIDIYAQQVAKEAAAYAWDAAMRYINDDSDFPMGEGKKKYPSKTEYLNQKFGQPLPEPKQ